MEIHLKRNVCDLTVTNESSLICDVWKYNLEEEMERVREVVQHYPYVSMDTEFPGVVARPVGTFTSSADHRYQTLRCNVDLLRIIQLGLTFTDSQGNLPAGICTWQFNFSFSLSEDMYAQDSIDLLKRSGIDFKRHESDGIDVDLFGELLISSGIVLEENIHWVSFHGGYDFAYLLKILTCQALPADEYVVSPFKFSMNLPRCSFFEILHDYFPCIYDIKYLMKLCKNMKGGLNELAKNLDVSRIGPQHQAGSDSLLTAATFFKMRRLFFNDSIDDKHSGVLFGLGTSYQVQEENLKVVNT